MKRREELFKQETIEVEERFIEPIDHITEDFENDIRTLLSSRGGSGMFTNGTDNFSY